MKLTAIAFAAAVVALTAMPAAAQAVYRCGSSYSQQPCPGGTQLEEAPRAPSPQDEARARAAAREDGRTAEAMEKARLKAEAKPVSAYIPPPKEEAVAQPQKPAASKSKKPPYFTAVAPGTKKKEKSAEKN